ncbi:hypothetical protein ISS05_04905 [Candidatus Woesearchaeota archaeon]|nr:hypothetical protein [Candidatus Woesearchaeota archaeon]
MNNKPAVVYGASTSDYSIQDYIHAINETATRTISAVDDRTGVEKILEDSKLKHTISGFGTFVRSVYHEIYNRINVEREKISKEKFGRVLLPLAAPSYYSSIGEEKIVACNLEAFEATKKEYEALAAIREYLIYWDPREDELTGINSKKIESR